MATNPLYPEKVFTLGLTQYKKFLETGEFIEFIDKLQLSLLSSFALLVGNNTFTGTNIFKDILVDNRIDITDTDTFIERGSAGNMQIYADDELLLSSQESIRIKINKPVDNASFPDAGDIVLELSSGGLDGLTGGDGGSLTAFGGDGKSISGAGSPGDAGLLQLGSGNGGDAANSRATNGGEISITSGNGGVSSTDHGGDGGVINITSGHAGIGSTIGGQGGDIQIVLGDGAAGSTNGRGGSLIIQPGEKGGVGALDGVVSIQDPSATHNLLISPTSHINGLTTKNILKIKYDITNGVDPGIIGANVSTQGAQLPINSYVTNAWYIITTGFDSASGIATLAIGIDTDDATGIEAATATFLLGQGIYQADPNNVVGNFTTRTTANRNIIFTVGTDPLTQGVMYLFLEYITL